MHPWQSWEWSCTFLSNFKILCCLPTVPQRNINYYTLMHLLSPLPIILHDLQIRQWPRTPHPHLYKHLLVGSRGLLTDSVWDWTAVRKLPIRESGLNGKKAWWVQTECASVFWPGTMYFPKPKILYLFLLLGKLLGCSSQVVLIQISTSCIWLSLDPKV